MGFGDCASDSRIAKHLSMAGTFLNPDGITEPNNCSPYKTLVSYIKRNNKSQSPIGKHEPF
jgi:hypothetical protein